MRYEYTLELGMKILDIVMRIVKRDNSIEYLERFLTGNGAAAIPIRNQKGQLENDCNAVLQAIYTYYFNHPEDRIDKLTETALIEIFKTCSKIDDVIDAARIVQYHLNNEQQKTTPFKMDCIKILQEYRNNIERNKKEYQKRLGYEKLGYINEEINRIASRKH